MRAFITGSHAYGTPTEESDVDLVILVDWATLDKLNNLSEKGLNESATDSGDISLRFGKLNLICVADEAIFAAWKLGTAKLEHEAHKKKGKKFDKQAATAILDNVREFLPKKS